ncbi:hypothetical protein C8R43DRAFT_561578 [Mycena crocata]|nr:hypothetical protein C8R43DRAFT_561578 [Mycena crocata]
MDLGTGTRKSRRTSTWFQRSAECSCGRHNACNTIQRDDSRYMVSQLQDGDGCSTTTYPKGISRQNLLRIPPCPRRPFQSHPSADVGFKSPASFSAVRYIGQDFQSLGGLDRRTVRTYTDVPPRAFHNGHSTQFRLSLSVSDFGTMERIHWTWSWVDYVPPSFLSEDPGQTLVEVDEVEEPCWHGVMKMHVDVKSELFHKHEHEPQRRLLPHELEQEPDFSAIDDETDDSMSSDSHITGVDDPEEFALASMARGDYELDSWHQKSIETWVASASGVVEEEMLLNDDQIEEDSKEQPRVATNLNLDLNKPDYLSQHKIKHRT